MFTGIVEEMGIVRRIDSVALAVRSRAVVVDLGLGESVAVNGVCLTVVSRDDDAFTVEVMPETLRRTNIGRLRVGGAVNLERALRPSSRIGGHFVQGHVDGTGRLAVMRREGEALLARIEAPREILRYVVEKGFIAVDGVSLTVVDVTERDFGVSLVGFTQRSITLSQQRPGYLVNLEVDILGKYVERFLRRDRGNGGVTEDLLAQHGFL